jgi:hypothetical protein
MPYYSRHNDGLFKNVSDAFVAVGSNSAVLNVMCVQFVIAVVLLTGTGEWLARWFISRPIVKGRPLLMVIFMFLAGILIGPRSAAWLVPADLERDLRHQRRTRL